MAMPALATILIRPRETIRSVVARPYCTRAVILLVVCGALSDLIRSVRWQLYRQSPQFAAMMPRPWIICASLAGILIVILLLFYLFAYLVWGIGRLLGGTGDRRVVRVALAWSFAPLIWALLYRIPVALFQPAVGASLDKRSAAVALHSAIAAMSLYALVSSAVIVLLTVVVDIWCFTIASVALSEVNGFSTWRGAATLGFSLLAPLIVVAAYFISRAV
jgi:hypothetical protein